MFKPSSYLTFETVDSDRNRLLCYLQLLETDQCWIDLRDVLYCDSAGLAFLMEARRLCRSYQKTFQTTSIPKTIDALAVFCGVDGMLTAEVL